MRSWLWGLIFTLITLLFLQLRFTQHEAMTSNGTTIYLLGDSVLNNARYVPAAQSVEAQLQRRLSVPLQNLAEDGAKIDDLRQQISQLDVNQVQHVVLSIGGNNILAGDRLGDMQQQMQQILTLLWQKVPAENVTVLLVYQPHDPTYNVYRNDIQAWNSWLRQHSGKMTVVDLMYFLRDPDDFAYVEPSWQGSAKIANALVGYLGSPVQNMQKKHVFLESP